MHLIHAATLTVFLSPDASVSWVCGAVWKSQCLQGSWDSTWEHVNTTVKELVPIVIAAAVWWHQRSGRHVLCYCDNIAGFQAVQKGSVKEPIFMHLLRCLTIFTSFFHFFKVFQNLPGNVMNPA